MLTARGEEGDRILGLQVGADDYVTKPFSPRELVLRAGSVLRRARGHGRGREPRAGVEAPPTPEILAIGGLEVDLTAHQARLAGEPLALTGREFDLLAFLMANPGQAFSRAELMQQVWGWSFGDQSTVTVHVRRLREKIEPDPASPSLIVTVWGVGYRLESAEDPDA
jgi:DNA-binding response OmpR family regulator